MSIEVVRDALVSKFASTAEWRRSLEFTNPDDSRNGAAADILDSLAGDCLNLTVETAQAYERAHDGDNFRVTEIEQEALRAIGFHSHPTSVAEFINGLTSELART